jgi:thiol-disulfide isomerase/thioredoxin
MKSLYILAGIILLSFNSCIEVNNSFDALPPGIWRGTLELDNTPFAVEAEEVSTKKLLGDVLPFLFELKYNPDNTFFIEIINGEERIKVDDIRYGRDKATAKDTVYIDFPVYDSYIKAIYEENIMEGYWYVNYRENYAIPFKAYYGQDHLFTTNLVAPADDLSGKWAATFEIETEDEYPAVGEFIQSGNSLTGTFLTETGDYRYLSGQVIGERMYLSTFDGAHAFLFKGKISEKDNLVGIFRSGKHYTTDWIAERDPDASLTNPFELTKMLNENEPLDFSFADTKGNQVTLDDDRFKGKIKIVQIMGTWCPNCKDETKFLKSYLMDENPGDVVVIAIAFEKYREEEKSMEVLKRFKAKWDIPYPVLLGGYHEKAEAILSLPMLNKIISYPTLLFVDEDNKVRKVYTGFSGPATSGFEQFKKDFYSTLSQLRTES